MNEAAVTHSEQFQAGTAQAASVAKTVVHSPTVPRAVVLCLIFFGAGLLWAYWPVFVTMAGHWWNDPQYTHGVLVPLFSGFLLWWRRDQLAAVSFRVNPWGLALVLAGLGLRLFGARIYHVFTEQISLLPCLAGVALLLGGSAALRWAWPAIVFLLFMIPLPFAVETALARELRVLVTNTSVYTIQTLGLPALAEGTRILVDDSRLEVAPACCGLGMLFTFFALTTGILFIIERPWIDKAVIFLSALPIAILSNIIRVTITALLFHLSANDAAHKFVHDWAGYLMMPVGLLILWLELAILRRLFIEEPPQRLSVKNPETVAARP
jgi:exosortase